jgi:peptide chain release factor 1
MSSIVDKLEAIKARFDELGIALTNPEVVNDNKRLSQVSREYHKLEKIVTPYKVYRGVLDSPAFAKEILETESDEELRTMAKDDMETLNVQQQQLEDEIKKLLIPTCRYGW